MRETPNLLLKLPEENDFVQVEDLNENFAKIDEEIAKITDEETGVEAKLTKHLDEISSYAEFGLVANNLITSNAWVSLNITQRKTKPFCTLNGITVQIEQDGTYEFNVSAAFDLASTGIGSVSIKYNNDYQKAFRTTLSTVTTVTTAHTVKLDCKVGDVIEFGAYQSSDGDLNVLSSEQLTYLQISKVV